MVRLNGILKGDKLVLVEFFATWCPHCQKMRPILDRVEKENKEYLQDPDSANQWSKLLIPSHQDILQSPPNHFQ